MPSKDKPQSQAPNGASSNIATNAIPSDPVGSIRRLFDIVEVCSRHESIYRDAEKTASDLEKARIDLEKASEKLQRKVTSYDDLYQTTSDHRRKMNEEKEGLKVEKEKLHKELQSHTAKLEQHKQSHATLQRQFREQEQTLKKMEDTLAQEKARSKGLDRDLAAKGDECKSVNASLRDTREQLLKWQEYQSKLVPVDPRSFHDTMESVWQDAVRFAEKYFRVDVSTAILGKQKDWVNEAQRHFPATRVPSFPASNSDAAKDMRMALALAVFASLISKYILLPTYISGGDGQPGELGETDDASLHSLLLYQADEDDKASLLCRALLLSLFSLGEQSERMEAAMTSVTNEFYTFAGQLLPEPNQYPEFIGDLRSLVNRVMEPWQVAQRSTVMFEVGLGIARLDPWTGFGSSVPLIPSAAEDSQAVEAAVSREDVVLFLFPGFSITSTGSDHPVFPSMVLTKSQLKHVEHEFKSEQRRASGNQRRPSGRRRDSVVRNDFLGGSP